MVGTLSESEWRDRLAPFRSPRLRPAIVQMVNTALPFIGLWYAMYLSLSVSYWLTLALAIPQAFLLTRLFIIQHDCGHGSFFGSRRANDAVGSVIGVITLFPYAYWRRTHALHHATSGKLDQREFGDIKTFTAREYLALSWTRRFAYRFYRHPLVLLGIGPTYQFVFKHRFPFDIPRSWKREWASVLWTNLGIAAIVAALVTTIGWKAFLMVQVPIVLIGGAIGVFLFYCQHQYENTYWERGADWSAHDAAVAGSSYLDLPRWLHWATGNIGFHHIHHLASQIPNYRLRDCFEANRDLPYIRLTIADAARTLSLRLWDEDRQTMIDFRGLRGLEPIASGVSVMEPELEPVRVARR